MCGAAIFTPTPSRHDRFCRTSLPFSAGHGGYLYPVADQECLPAWIIKPMARARTCSRLCWSNTRLLVQLSASASTHRHTHDGPWHECAGMCGTLAQHKITLRKSQQLPINQPTVVSAEVSAPHTTRREREGSSTTQRRVGSRVHAHSGPQISECFQDRCACLKTLLCDASAAVWA